MLRQAEPWRWSMTVVLAALVGIAAGHTVIGSLGSISVVDGLSMAPTYTSGARVYTVPLSGQVQRGDIVLVDDGKKEYALKRIVGMPGETVQLWRGYVFINRKMLIEPYLPKYTYTFPEEHSEKMSFRLGDDQYFVLGDNRLVSVDSRTYGPVAGTHIKSRIPLPESAVRARFAMFTLPNEGKRTIRMLSEDN
ncbi:MAG TPA: signal peptidase I [Candidatus Acidoferrum sp.]|nr:signal peptidase I [Candidatus Acidoferrum sp.]